ncbi:MAG TPA: hypothetical protein VI756_09675, partial [Blastocatellia bacterium]
MKSSALAYFITAIVVLVGLSCQSVLAQDGKSGIELPAPDTSNSQSASITGPTPGVKLRPPPIVPSVKQGPGIVASISSAPYLKPPQFVIKDEAAYLTLEMPSKIIPIPIAISGNVIYIPTDITAWLVPIAGGGKSGCFGAGSTGQVVQIVNAVGEKSGQ